MLNQNKPRQSWTTSFTAPKKFLEKLDKVGGDIPRSVFIRECVDEKIEEVRVREMKTTQNITIVNGRHEYMFSSLNT